MIRNRVAWVYFGGCVTAALGFLGVVAYTSRSPLSGTTSPTTGEAALAVGLAALGIAVAYWRFVWPRVVLTDSSLRSWTFRPKPRVVGRSEVAAVNVDRVLGAVSVALMLKSNERVVLGALEMGWGESRLQGWQEDQAQILAAWADVAVERSSR